MNCKGEITKIDSGIPVPTKTGWTKTHRRYPVAEMKVGQSFFVPTEMLPPKGQDSVRVATYRQGKRYGMETLCREVVGGVRVWRIK